ncbi:restriction endonuclease [Aeromicrobium fastidiosum]|uniref:restriction endonuclease n=1 Tax=Aeromicrobium fastidiosum TaxID=52699 RepID=UPI00165F3804|nr:hypothetical protein [Aeromicrobium fastidiosum]
MKPWRQYQEEAAAYFRELGLASETDVTLEGARTSHDLDVVVRFERAGLEHLWIVECKHHARPISKDRPLLLRQIVDDVGGDKGILLAEGGYQSGAYEAARFSNISLASLAELRATADDEILDVAINEIETRVRAARGLLYSLSKYTRHPRGGSGRLPTTPSDWDKGGAIGLLGHLSILESGMTGARARHFPATYGFASDGSVLRADRKSFVVLARATIEVLESVANGLEPVEDK